MTDPSPDFLFGQHPKIACLSSSGQKRYIYSPDLPADPILEGSQRQVGQTSPNRIVWLVCVGMVFFKVWVGDFWTDAGPSSGPSFMDPPPPDLDFNDMNHDHKNAYYVHIHGYPWMSMENHGINGYLYISMHFHECPWISMDIGQRPVAKRGPTISAPPQAAHLGVVDNSGVCRTSSNDHPAEADRGARPPVPPRRTQPPW